LQGIRDAIYLYLEPAATEVSAHRSEEIIELSV
jgi:hypothetical protein